MMVKMVLDGDNDDNISITVKVMMMVFMKLIMILIMIPKFVLEVVDRLVDIVSVCRAACVTGHLQ